MYENYNITKTDSHYLPSRLSVGGEEGVDVDVTEGGEEDNALPAPLLLIITFDVSPPGLIRIDGAAGGLLGSKTFSLEEEGVCRGGRAIKACVISPLSVVVVVVVVGSSSFFGGDVGTCGCC